MFFKHDYELRMLYSNEQFTVPANAHSFKGKRARCKGVMIAYVGDLDNYFSGNMDFNESFLECLINGLNHSVCRYYVLEISRSNQDINSIGSSIPSIETNPFP